MVEWGLLNSSHCSFVRPGKVGKTLGNRNFTERRKEFRSKERQRSGLCFPGQSFFRELKWRQLLTHTAQLPHAAPCLTGQKMANYCTLVHSNDNMEFPSILLMVMHMILQCHIENPPKRIPMLHLV